VLPNNLGDRFRYEIRVRLVDVYGNQDYVSWFVDVAQPSRVKRELDPASASGL